jgi:hypothetical protein
MRQDAIFAGPVAFRADERMQLPGKLIIFPWRTF